MKRQLIIGFIFLLLVLDISAQEISEKSGKVTFITSQHIYVRFENTVGMFAGDTLYVADKNIMVPVCTVKGLSSVSCSCIPLLGFSASIGMKLSLKQKTVKSDSPDEQTYAEPLPEIKQPEKVPVNDTSGLSTTKLLPKQSIKGRISIASYSVITGAEEVNSQRMRYNFNLSAKNIADSRFSAETQLSFSHRNGKWNDIRSNVFNGLKIYSLAAIYESDDRLLLRFGRKINPKVANLGAIDGLQAEYRFGSLTAGIIAGSRPDYRDYSFNTSLVQYGAYLNFVPVSAKGKYNTSVAFLQQNNSGKIDRRFTYLQHYQQITKDIGFFGSAEFDLYRVDIQDNSLSPGLTNLYMSLRYRYKNLGSASLAYSNRKNIIFYETYKDFLEQLLEQETSQGYLLNINIRPFKKFTAGLQGGYRFRQDDAKPSENINIYLNYSELPYVKVSVSAGGTYLLTPFIRGSALQAGLSRNFLQGKFNSSLSYKFSNYTFFESDFSQMQHAGELSAQYRLKYKVSVSLFYEAVYDQRYMNHRLFAQISKSF